MKQLRLSTATKQILLFFLENSDQYYTSEDVIKKENMKYSSVHHVLHKLEQHDYLESKKRRGRKGPALKYKATELGITEAMEVHAKAVKESKYNKVLREAIQAQVEKVREDRGITKAEIAELVSKKLSGEKTMPHQYLADLMVGRKNLLTGSCIALLDALNLELEVNVVRKRVGSAKPFKEPVRRRRQAS